MKNVSIILLCLLLGFSIQIKAQKTAGFKLTGKFKGLPDGTKLYLRTQENDTVAKTISKEDQFSFNGTLSLNGRFHFIVMDTMVSKLPTKAIFLMNKPITVLGVVGTREITVSNSSGQDEYLETIITQRKIRQVTENEKQLLEIRKNALQEYNNKSIDSLAYEKKMAEIQSKMQAIEDDRTQKFLDYIRTLPTNSLYVPLLIQSIPSLIEKEKAYIWLSKIARSSYYGVQLKNIIETEKILSKIQEGAIIPNFSIKNLDGKQMNVLEIAAKSKYTLIDCWASWCKPCRAEVPELKKIYAEFKDRGLNILGVSSDKNALAWRKAVAEDGTTWLHGIEDKEMPVGKLFDLKAIPAYILIDNKGKLIAFDSGMSRIQNFGGGLRGEELKKKMGELLGTGKSR